MQLMSTKSIVITIVVLLVAIGAGYVFMNHGSTNPPPAAQATGAAPTDQVQAKDVSIGSGTQAAPGTVVSVLYEGKLTNGTTFDSSAAHGNQPLTFQLGAQGLIPGFQVGVNGMKEGGERIISIPPALGYGTQEIKDPSGKVIIPANSTIVFDVKLVKVAAAPAPAATTTTKAASTTDAKTAPVPTKAK